MLREQRRHALAIREIELDELKIVKLGQLGAARVLQLRIVIGVQVVDADNVAAALQQPPCDMEADKAGRAGDENGPAGRMRCQVNSIAATGRPL